MLEIYKSLMRFSSPALEALLKHRSRAGKENPHRLGERMGMPGRSRPTGELVWFHAASVGEAQSTLILVNAILERLPQAHVLVTTGTLTSAQLMAQRLPARAFHQFYPLDHPVWVRSFLDHWRPDLVLWMESELWPSMLGEIRRREIPALLVNARLSPRSRRRWAFGGKTAQRLLQAFGLVMAQTEDDAAAFRALGAPSVIVTGNLKYGAAALPCDEQALHKMRQSIGGRPLWLYASTHDGEEDIACRLHRALKEKTPGLLTVIVPRHPERRAAVLEICRRDGLAARLRGAEHALPQDGDDIYIGDTLGELGLFYRLAPIACIGRSFSDDGGGGHNPVEAAQLGCAVLHGPHVQNLAEIYADMDRAGAAVCLRDEEDFRSRLEKLLHDKTGLTLLRQKASSFAAEKERTLGNVLAALSPWLEKPVQRACA